MAAARFWASTEFASSLMAPAHRSRSRTRCALRPSRLNINSTRISSRRFAVIMKRQPRSNPRPQSGKARRTVSIVGTGSYVPDKRLTNADLSQIVDTSDEWITTRTGIKERRIAAKDELTSDMAAKAALKALEQAKVKPEDIDLILVATATPDMLFPATACFVQKKIGAKKAACLDVSAACAGFLFAIEIAQQFITSHTHDTVLVIGAEKLTSITNWTDRNTCVLFGDGAGAAGLCHRGSTHGVVSTHIGSDGQFSDILFMPGGGSRCPITRDNVDMNLATIDRKSTRLNSSHTVISYAVF